jgi:hypothetical protein
MGAGRLGDETGAPPLVMPWRPPACQGRTGTGHKIFYEKIIISQDDPLKMNRKNIYQQFFYGGF